jgi:glycosyltransferase involved in cell wall biosynthesis
MADGTLHRLVMIGPAAQARGGVASVIEAYRAHGLFKRWPIEYLATHGERGRNAALALGALRRLAALALHRHRTVLHLHAAAGPGLLREALFIALAVAARCPFILHLHGGGFERFHAGAPPSAQRALRFAFERAACVLVPCASSGAWVRGVARNAQVAWVPSPVAPMPAPAEPRCANLVLYLGTLDPAKGLHDLFAALAALRSALPDVRLLCAGEGDRAAAAREAGRLGVGDAVKFTGWVGPSGRRALLESAAVFALPSYHEALPMSLLEAMAAGLPAVVSAVGGMPEMVADGVTGFLVAPGDTATLQRLLRKLLLDPALRSRVGAAARESVRLRCAPERAVPRLEEVYAAVGLGTPAAAPPEPKPA